MQEAENGLRLINIIEKKNKAIKVLLTVAYIFEAIAPSLVVFSHPDVIIKRQYAEQIEEKSECLCYLANGHYFHSSFIEFCTLFEQYYGILAQGLHQVWPSPYGNW